MSETPPDLTLALVDWLKANYPQPEWDGDPATSPEYFKRLGVYHLTLSLEAHLTEEQEAEDAQSALP